MAINFNSAKNLCKLGIRIIIGLLVLDVLWTLIRYIFLKTIFSDTLPVNFLEIDHIITNSVVIISLVLFVIGLAFITKHFFSLSKLSLITVISLSIVIVVRVLIIIFNIVTIINSSLISETVFEALDMTAYILFIVSYIILSLYQMQLKKHSVIGLGHSLLPYFFGFFGLVYPITNLLNILQVPYLTSPNLSKLLTFIHMFSYFAVILEIIMFFDLLRRIDSLQETPIIEEQVEIQKTE
ncbi:MAG: hypothetical protein FK733_18315 [Asgard group archaeon]|nr:hypothetical protein [Asgard group archaeon]